MTKQQTTRYTLRSIQISIFDTLRTNCFVPALKPKKKLQKVVYRLHLIDELKQTATYEKWEARDIATAKKLATEWSDQDD
jgi:hypothetical protein